MTIVVAKLVHTRKVIKRKLDIDEANFPRLQFSKRNADICKQNTSEGRTPSYDTYGLTYTIDTTWYLDIDIGNIVELHCSERKVDTQNRNNTA